MSVIDCHEIRGQILTEAKKDKTTVCYSLKFTGFRDAQSLLQAIIEENKKAGII